MLEGGGGRGWKEGAEKEEEGGGSPFLLLLRPTLKRSRAHTLESEIRHCSWHFESVILP